MKYVMKVINALIAAAIFPAAYFLDLIFIQVGTNKNAQWIFQLLGSDSPGIGIEESFSIHDFVQIARGEHTYSYIFEGMSGKFTWPEAFAPINGRVITFAVCFAICLLIALFIIIFSICSSKKLPVAIAAGAGLISAIIMIACFNSAADIITSGQIPMQEILGSTDAWLTNLLLGFIGVDTLVLGGFHSAFVIIFICIIVWTGAFALVEIGDSKEEPAKKAKH